MPGSAGDPADQALRQRNGLEQGRGAGRGSRQPGGRGAGAAPGGETSHGQEVSERGWGAGVAAASLAVLYAPFFLISSCESGASLVKVHCFLVCVSLKTKRDCSGRLAIICSVAPSFHRTPYKIRDLS